MAIMMMTAATPMMMPRVESRVRLLLLSMAVIATRNRLRILISMRVYVWVLVVLGVGEGCKGFGGGEYVGVVCVLADLAVAEHDVAPGHGWPGRGRSGNRRDNAFPVVVVRICLLPGTWCDR